MDTGQEFSWAFAHDGVFGVGSAKSEKAWARPENLPGVGDDGPRCFEEIEEPEVPVARQDLPPQKQEIRPHAL
jgi:hypothetical protein